jgi:hypothetical protein
VGYHASYKGNKSRSRLQVPFHSVKNYTTGFHPWLVPLEYRGKSYTIVQGIEPNLWKWKVQLTRPPFAAKPVRAPRR